MAPRFAAPPGTPAYHGSTYDATMPRRPRGVKDLFTPSIDDAEAALGSQIARQLRRQRLEHALQAEEDDAQAEQEAYAAQLQRRWRSYGSGPPSAKPSPYKQPTVNRPDVDPLVMRELAAMRAEASALAARLEISEARAFAAEQEVARLSGQLPEDGAPVGSAHAWHTAIVPIIAQAVRPISHLVPPGPASESKICCTPPLEDARGVQSISGVGLGYEGGGGGTLRCSRGGGVGGRPGGPGDVNAGLSMPERRLSPLR